MGRDVHQIFLLLKFNLDRADRFLPLGFYFDVPLNSKATLLHRRDLGHWKLSGLRKHRDGATSRFA